MSVSFLVIIIGLQILLCTPYGLNLFPVRGWQVLNLSSYLYFVTVPTMALVLVTLGYNTRFYRAVMVDEIERDHITALKAYGATPTEITVHVSHNFFTAWRIILGKQGRRLHDLPGLTISALRNLLFDPCLLQWMRTVV